MPELPEIETIKNDLAPHVVGKTIIKITFPPDSKMRILRRVPSQDAFLAALQGVRVHTIRRRAKYLLLELDSSQTLIMHLGMSGQLLLRSGHAPMEPYVRAILHFGNKTELRFNDPRKFGELLLHPPSSDTASLNLDRLGPEPLEQEFSVAYLTHRLRGSRRKIKTFLLDQTAIAGLGNIYSDESLFSAKIHPARISNTLHDDEILLLRQSIRAVLKQAIKNRGTTASDRRYRDGLGRMGEYQTLLRVYQRRGNPCYFCGTIIESLRIGGRTASFCPQCQS